MYTDAWSHRLASRLQWGKTELSLAHPFPPLVGGLRSQRQKLSFAPTSAPTSPSAGPQGACERAERRPAAVHLLRSTSPPPVTDGRCNHSASERGGEVTTVLVIGWDRDRRPLSLPTSLVTTANSSTASPSVRAKMRRSEVHRRRLRMPKLGKFRNRSTYLKICMPG